MFVFNIIFYGVFGIILALYGEYIAAILSICILTWIYIAYMYKTTVDTIYNKIRRSLT